MHALVPLGCNKLPFDGEIILPTPVVLIDLSCTGIVQLGRLRLFYHLKDVLRFRVRMGIDLPLPWSVDRRQRSLQ